MSVMRHSTERKMKRRGSFTLIELLVVVAIILLLLGMSLKIMSVINRKATTARTIWILEQVKNSLGAYYSTYGSYPPVSFVGYEYEKTPMSELPALPPSMNWKTGMVYYIYSADKHNPEAAPWQHYLKDIGSYGMTEYSNRIGAAWIFWSNKTHSIADAWDRGIYYRSDPPDYQRYLLWSAGPNGTDEGGGGDDIGVQAAE